MEKLLEKLRTEKVYISLEGENLKINFNGEKLPDGILEELKAKKEDLKNYLKNTVAASKFDQIPVVEKEDNCYRLSSSQKRLWILSQHEDSSKSYNMPFHVELKGNYDVDSFKKAVMAVIERHESLRTVFITDKTNEVWQKIVPAEDINFSIDYRDYRLEANIKSAVEHYINEDSFKLFDLEKGPLLRATLLQVGEADYVFYYNMHHIISDAWSLQVLANDVFAYYNAFKNNTAAALSPLRIQYKDYSSWQQNRLEEDSFLKNKSFWMEKLSGEIPTINLPSNTIRPKVKTSNGQSLETYLDAATTKNIKEFVHKKGGSLFMGLISVFKVLIYKYTAQEDILIGTLLAGRDHIDLENQIGFYVNALALRNQIDTNDSFIKLYDKIKESTINSFAHRTYPFDLLIDDLKLKNDLSRNVLIDVLFVLQNASERIENYQISDEQTTSFADKGNIFSRFDLEISLKEIGTCLHMEINYNTDVYQRDMIEAMMTHYKQLLAFFTNNPEETIASSNCLTAQETNKLLNGFNHTHTDRNRTETVLDLFNKQVQNSGNKTALIYKDKKISYKELNQLSNQFSNFLKSNYGLEKNDLAGIKLHRSEWLAVAILGILKSGGAYLPIDPTYPDDKIAYIEKDSALKLCIDAAVIEQFLAQKDTFSDADTTVAATPDTLAYVIYTSGSTGSPKGVSITHFSLANYITWGASHYFNEGDEASFGLFTSLSFDLTVTSLFLPLIKGDSLHIFDSDEDISELLAQYLKADIKAIKLTPAHITIIGSLGIDGIAIEKAIVGGDILHTTHIKILKKLNPNIKIYNEYGPTEATVGCIVHEVALDEENVLIGKPIANMEAYVLNKSLGLAPIGVTGELFLAGEGLAQGYLNNPTLTAEKFIPHPFKQGEKVYTTGDLAFWTADGNLKFLGRKDNQVKVQGYRIELGEVEHTLLQNETIKEVVVLAIENDFKEKELVAYFTSSKREDEAALRSHFKGLQPEYMVPASFIQLDEFPLTSNGKIDKKQLADNPLVSKRDAAPANEPPANETEQKVIEIWQNVLKRENIGVQDDFYLLGGNSLKLIRLINEYHNTFNVKLKMKDLFANPVLQDQAKILRSSVHADYFEIEKASPAENYPLSEAQKTLWYISQVKERSAAYNIPVTVELKGSYDADKFIKAINAVAERHEILRTVFKENESGEGRQWIIPADEMNIPVSYFDYRNETDKTNKALQYIAEDSFKPFDIENGPLLRAALFQIEEEHYLFYYNMFHIISDEVSMNVLKRDALAFYISYIENTTPDLPVLNMQYKDYAVWQLKSENGAKFTEDKNYWKNKLSGNLPLLNLPSQNIRPAVKTYNGYNLGTYISAETSAKLKAFCNNQGGSLFMGALTAWYILFYKCTNANDIIIGTPVAGREHLDLKDQIGCYINNIALRQQIEPDNDFISLFQEVKQSTISNFEHQLYPFYRIVEDLQLKNDLGRNHIFDVMFSFHIADENQKLDGIKYTDKIIDYGAAKSKLDILINFYEYGELLYFDINFNTDIYSKKAIEEVMGGYKMILNRLLENPEESIANLDYKSEMAKEKNLKNLQKLKLLKQI